MEKRHTVPSQKLDVHTKGVLMFTQKSTIPCTWSPIVSVEAPHDPNLHSVRRLNYLEGAHPPGEDPVPKLSPSSVQARSCQPQEKETPP